ncbi:hypothetical protein CCHR01_10802 [Colletotrichum chrysophilum]|uniref:Uncharacterized protein n=1 Tax=Colletotrichum chrysophilum TaxID=1836956 RepID=A0AAD9AFX0_9PEZI|nr:hypothetical protein CCHR01_10802 [Colletotrichum chrysophilum]
MARKTAVVAIVQALVSRFATGWDGMGNDR